MTIKSGFKNPTEVSSKVLEIMIYKLKGNGLKPFWCHDCLCCCRGSWPSDFPSHPSFIETVNNELKDFSKSAIKCSKTREEKLKAAMHTIYSKLFSLL